MRSCYKMDGFMTRFICKYGKNREEYYYHSKKEAENHLNMFIGDDSGLYSSVEVIDLKTMERVAMLTQSDFK